MACRSLNDIVTEINEIINSGLNYADNNYYTVAVLQEKDDKAWPMTYLSTTPVDPAEAVKIVPSDTDTMNFYHRIIGSENEVNPSSGKGIEAFRQKIWTMRLVGIGYRPNIFPQNKYWDNEEFAAEIEEILGIYTVLTGKEIITVTGQTNTNKIEILNSEYGGNEVINRRNILRLVAFSIDYTIQQRIIGNQTPVVGNAINGILNFEL